MVEMAGEVMDKRYSRNLEALSWQDVETLHGKKVCVVGCGGLGGHIIETLARIGVLHFTVVDSDVFDESNLNRQLFCTEDTIGQSKTESVKRRIAQVNSSAHVNTVSAKLEEDNAQEIIAEHDVVMDALDSISARLVLVAACKQAGIPLVHGAIAGWQGQVATVFPGDETLNLLYANSTDGGAWTKLGNLPFTASLVAAVQSAEAVKILTGKEDVLRNKILLIDLTNNSFDTVAIAQ